MERVDTRETDWIFWQDEGIIASRELVFSRVPLVFRLRILRLDRSLPPRAVAEVASHGMKVSIMAFRVTEELRYDPKYIKALSRCLRSGQP